MTYTDGSILGCGHAAPHQYSPRLGVNIADRATWICVCGEPYGVNHGLGTGVARSPDGRTMCYSCVDDAIRADILAGTPVTLYDSGERPQYIVATAPTDTAPGTLTWHAPRLTSWSGGELLTVLYRRTYRHNFGGRMAAVTARDSNGRYWHGRHSADNCQCVTMYRARAAGR